MSVDYSREYCADFVKRMLAELDDAGVAALWFYFAFHKVNGESGIQPSLDGARKFAYEFDHMSHWNKQGVLFTLVPEIERLAKERAHDAASVARQKEPL